MTEKRCLGADSSWSMCRLSSSMTSEKITGNKRQAVIQRKLTEKPISLNMPEIVVEHFSSVCCLQFLLHFILTIS